MRRAMCCAVGLAAAGVILAGCADKPAQLELSSVAHPYDGPLDVKLSYADRASVLERSGAAGKALECDGLPYSGGGGDYADSGLESAQDSARDALDNMIEKEFLQLPVSGYEVERDDGDRVLFSYDVGGETKVAFVAADGLEDYNDNTGWGIEAWASCDPSELPASESDRYGVEIWSDGDGHRVPVTTVQSYAGPEHCGWQDIVFVQLGAQAGGADDAPTYVRDVDGELKRWLQTTYDGAAERPSNATDTGWQHDGRELWVVPSGQAAYLVSTSDASDVERWPAQKEPILCA